MEAKIDGENAVRRMYADPTVVDRLLGYKILRPGGSTTETAAGAAALELNQGDRVSGRLPRADVAALAVESIYSAAAFDTTFECYEALTVKPLEAVGFSNLCTYDRFEYAFAILDFLICRTNGSQDGATHTHPCSRDWNET